MWHDRSIPAATPNPSITFCRPWTVSGPRLPIQTGPASPGWSIDWNALRTSSLRGTSRNFAPLPERTIRIPLRSVILMSGQTRARHLRDPQARVEQHDGDRPVASRSAALDRAEMRAVPCDRAVAGLAVPEGSSWAARVHPGMSEVSAAHRSNDWTAESLRFTEAGRWPRAIIGRARAI